MGHEVSVSYKPKGVGLNKNPHRFTEDLIEHLKKELEYQLYYFGYCNHPEKENPLAFLKFDEHKPEMLEVFEAFREQNKEAMEWVTKDPESLKKIDYVVNRPEDMVKIDRPYYPDMILKTEIKLTH